MLRVCGFRMASVKSLLILWSEVCCNTFLSLSLFLSLSPSQTNLLTPSISYSDTHSDENTHTRTTTSTPLSHFLHSHKHSLSPLVSTSLCLNTAFFLSLRCLQYHSISLSLSLSPFSSFLPLSHETRVLALDLCVSKNLNRPNYKMRF